MKSAEAGKQAKGMLSYAAALNGAHLALCLCLRGAIALGIYAHSALQAFAFAADIALWAAFSIACSLGRNDSDPNRGGLFALSALSPFFFLCALAYALQGVAKSWAAMALLGAPINFYMRPLVLIARYLPPDAYLCYLASATALIITAIFAYAYGAKLNRR